jgi:hypothetical protein
MFPYFPNFIQTMAAERTADLRRAAAMHRAARQVVGAVSATGWAARPSRSGAARPVSRVAPACASAPAGCGVGSASRLRGDAFQR